jgi:hypothetical protein
MTCNRAGMRAFLSVVAACVLLSGCGAIRTVYNQAEFLAAWRADDYFDLNDEQKRSFRTGFARLHAWHRATQLRAYAGLLDAIDTRLGRGPDLQDVGWAVDGVKAQSHRLVEHGYADAAAFLATLSDAQIAHARRRFERDNRKWAQEHGVGAPAAEQKRLRVKRDLETIEHWSGPLDREQRARVAALSDAQPLDVSLRHQDRLRRQREFVALLESRRAPGFAERLRDWLYDWNAGRPAVLQAGLQDCEQAQTRMLLTVYAELRPDQQRKVQERVRFYTNAMRDLARDAAQQADAGSIKSMTMP